MCLIRDLQLGFVLSEGGRERNRVENKIPRQKSRTFLNGFLADKSEKYKQNTIYITSTVMEPYVPAHGDKLSASGRARVPQLERQQRNSLAL